MPRVALVVDDSMLIRHTVCRFLEERGYRGRGRVATAMEALEIMKTAPARTSSSPTCRCRRWMAIN